MKGGIYNILIIVDPTLHVSPIMGEAAPVQMAYAAHPTLMRVR